MKRRKTVAALAAAVTLTVGAIVPTTMLTSTALAASGETVTVTPNPWYANGPFDGWGTSLAWFANATGNLGEDGFVTNRDQISDEAYQKALKNGKALRQAFYNSIFGEQGLDLNMARYNIGGGNATDVAYGYPFMRQGAAIPGYWADDPDGSKNLYNGTPTTYWNKDKVAEAFDPTNDAQYDWSKGKAQEWWLEQGQKTGDITHFEAFANSAPWFLTDTGHATGYWDWNSGHNNLANPQKFAQYMVTVTNHLEQKYGMQFNTIEPFNESETNYWGTPQSKHADSGYDSENNDLINRYWNRYYTDKNKAVTPYTTAVKKAQEGMHVDNWQQQETIKTLRAAMSNDDPTKIVATDATNAGDFVNSYKQYPQEVRDIIDQYNTHSYSNNSQREARDIAQTDGKKISQSEVDGSWQSGGFDPYNFSNGLGMAGKINSDIYALQSKDFNFWQVVEDLYNMSTDDKDVYGHTANPKGENLNWGTVFISFDCTVADEDGNLYSERDVDNNGGKTDGLQPCSVIVNSKYNAVRAYTKFVHEGDAIIANNRTWDTFTATAKDGKKQTIIHTNNSGTEQQFVIDLSKYGKIADDAAGKLYLTTAPTKAEGTEAYFGATPGYMNTFSNVEQKTAVRIDKKAKTATVTVPGKSIASIVLTGVTGVAKTAGIEDGKAYALIGEASDKTLTAKQSGDSALSLQEAADNAQDAANQTWTFHEVEAPAERPTLHRYVITGPEDKVLIARNDTNALEAMSIEDAKQNPAALWVLNTENGESYSLVNVEAKKAMDVNGASKDVGAKVGLYTSGGGGNQAWYVRNMKPNNADDIDVHTALDTEPQLPQEVTLNYDWGTAPSASVTWDTDGVAEKVKKAESFDIAGKAITAQGDEVPVTAHIHVGAFTVVDPTSITVGVHSLASDAKDKAPTSVHAHVVTSPAFDTPVTWDFSKVTDNQLAKSGKFTVLGTAEDGNGKTLPAKLTVYVTERDTSENIAPFAARATASSSERGYSPRATIDGKLSTNWSNWRSDGWDQDPWLQYDLIGKYPIDAVHFYVDQNRAEAAASKVEVQVKNAGGEWVDTASSDTVVTEAGKPTVIALPEGTVTDGVRLKLTYSTKADESQFAKVAEVELMAKVNPSAADDAALGDLRVDGVQIDGFKAGTTGNQEYKGKLAPGATAYPLIQAYATDNAAQITVTQPSAENGGKATIHVVSANGKQTSDTVVDFGELVKPTVDVTEPSSDGNGVKVQTAKQGDKVTLVARGFVPGHEVKFELHSDPVELGIAVADKNGVALKDAVIPENAVVGEHEIHAIDTESDAKAVTGLTVTAKDTKPDQPGKDEGTQTDPTDPKDEDDKDDSGKTDPKDEDSKDDDSKSDAKSDNDKSSDSKSAQEQDQEQSDGKYSLASTGSAIAGLVALVVLASIGTALLLWRKHA